MALKQLFMCLYIKNVYVYKISFFSQSLMEKYPDVEVRVFRGGESVGENHDHLSVTPKNLSLI